MAKDYMATIKQDEFTILKNVILRLYNLQYSTSFTAQDFDLVSIPPDVHFTLGYELSSIRADDFLRIRVYLNEGDEDNLCPFRVEVNQPDYKGTLGDEVYVAVGTIDRYYRESGRVKYLRVNTRDINYILAEDGTILLGEDGSPLIQG